MHTMPSTVTDMNYEEILKVWNMETPDDFAIFSELYYQMFGEDAAPFLTTQVQLHPHFSPMIEETMFIISGRFERPNGHVMHDELSYIKATKQEAIATCQRLNPHFHIHTVREEL